jgi:predicted DNA binding CopG/RHH family protein
MTEDELAADLQRSKEDSNQWGPPLAPEPARRKRRLAAMVSVRLSSAELEAVQARASQLNQSVSAYLRDVALRDAAPVAGAPVTASSMFSISIGTPEGYTSRTRIPGMISDGRHLYSVG